MHKPLHASLALAVALAVSGCATLVPATPVAAPAIPVEWPMPATTAAGQAAAFAPADPAISVLPMADVGWRDFFADPALETVVAQALDNNRDLRVAILNVERARAQYGIRRADRLPSLGANATMERAGGDVPASESFVAGIGLAAFELDLFGRVRNQSEAALQQYLATDAAQRATQLSLIAEVAGAWLALASDQEQLRLAESALETYERTLDLTSQRQALGATSALEVEQVRTQVEGTRSDVARLTGQVALDRNALDLLAGAPVPAELLPLRDSGAVAGITALPAGMVVPCNVTSCVLYRTLYCEGPS
jgi:multidrug efflux system outer membrane protein